MAKVAIRDYLATSTTPFFSQMIPLLAFAEASGLIYESFVTSFAAAFSVSMKFEKVVLTFLAILSVPTFIAIVQSITTFFALGLLVR